MNEPVADGFIAVLVLDDHQMVIEGVKTLLKSKPNIRVVAEANRGADALQLLLKHPEVRVVLTDLSMPQMSGLEFIRAAREVNENLRIVALSMFFDQASVTDVLNAGGCGYMLKSLGPDELIHAIEQVASGHTYFSPEVGSMLLQNMELATLRPTPTVGAPVPLTQREREVLELISKEYSNHHIAEKLFISERTVETHRKNILTKTNSKSIIGLIRYALRYKLIQ
ncbi:MULTISPECIES: response regulator [Hymenobacter]|uniref:response regulator n=1 Tax=Hymenobacter TaxID=89966 RepID=UPI0010588CB0|nr:MULTISPECIES: response regulator transcription factor [Hymenobacter]QIL77427.1 response regulator transcription factor [Hymenobacter sp. HDW8]